MTAKPNTTTRRPAVTSASSQRELVALSLLLCHR
jgi:hypothetical protein